MVGNSDFPLTTSFLTNLYLLWYKKEFEILKNKATYVPSYSGQDDFMRKGIPFLIRKEDDVEIVGEINLFPAEIFDDRWGTCMITMCLGEP